MDKKFSKEYRRKTWIIAIYDSDDQGSWMGKIEATKKEVKEILAAIVQSFRDRNLDFYEGGTETAENVRENWQPLEFWTPLENWPPFVNVCIREFLHFLHQYNRSLSGKYSGN